MHEDGLPLSGGASNVGGQAELRVHRNHDVTIHNYPAAHFLFLLCLFQPWLLASIGMVPVPSFTPAYSQGDAGSNFGLRDLVGNTSSIPTLTFMPIDVCPAGQLTTVLTICGPSSSSMTASMIGTFPVNARLLRVPYDGKRVEVPSPDISSQRYWSDRQAGQNIRG